VQKETKAHNMKKSLHHLSQNSEVQLF